MPGPSQSQEPDLASSSGWEEDLAAEPPGTRLLSLSKAVLVPRVNSGSNLPSARAWPPELANHGVMQEALLAAFGLGLVPNEYARGWAGALEGIAILSLVAVTYKRKKTYLARMNEAFLSPRRLHANVVSTKKTIKVLGIDKKAPLAAPLSEGTLDLSAQDRCLLHLYSWTCALQVNDLPPPRPQTTALAWLAQWEINYGSKEANKKVGRSRKRAWKRYQKGKKFKEDGAENRRAKGMSWIMVPNIHEWEQRKAEKQTKKEEKKRISLPGERSCLSRSDTILDLETRVGRKAPRIIDTRDII